VPSISFTPTHPGLQLEKHVREHAGESEPAWDNAGKTLGIQIWRVEQFQIKPVDYKADGALALFDGDSYIVLNTYKRSPDSDVLSYDLHFWLGEETTQDEAGTAAYKTVELDDRACLFEPFSVPF
jgi:gelsolin